MVRYLRFIHLLIVIVGLLLLSCGGGGSGNSATTTTNQSPNAVLSVFSNAATRGDYTTALSYFTPPTRDSLQGPLSDKDNLMALGDSLGKAVEYKNTGTTAIYKSTYTDNGKTYSFYIYLIKDDSGVWKIMGF